MGENDEKHGAKWVKMMNKLEKHGENDGKTILREDGGKRYEKWWRKCGRTHVGTHEENVGDNVCPEGMTQMVDMYCIN